ncbi:MurR/RpiR family transcriptional regulator [Photobacterium angustum]|uniref:MurR/RpiR family transcriptional regulator n=1 Tax=Photobacterium angustum TaxID=661 RepID=A0A855S9Y2_PHOAN|nr:MurR/RpiR family transcriptional regulator [Photobacterium angustum]KJG30092.1 transcriptional regulator [Photobacterium angustum]KJG40165.1 transcriptional regulator [Photobacterium angustum]KJG48508.1 transcriptional regulator [Photobacterium angustum]PSW88987.1 MurR/RpiR family transcriptional regulator [Photobacterium angustum]PSX06337.1 MurR/RpiR family transcriptional regulator [Photobacterium angustum]
MSVDVDIISQITERFSALRDAEKKVAQWIMDDIQGAANASITELAQGADVSEASITRFAKAIGCKNVRDMKIKLAQSLSVGQRFILEPPDQGGYQGIYESIKQSLDVNRSLIVEKDIDTAADWLHNARQVVAIGMGGGSTIAAQEMQHRLFRLGYPVVAYNDGLLSRMIAATAESSDVLVMISSTGYTPIVVETAQLAKEYGLKIIAITPINTPLAELASLVLPIKHQETDFIYKPSASRYAMLALVDVISMAIAVKNKRRSRDKLRRLKVALDAHRGGLERQPLGD